MAKARAITQQELLNAWFLEEWLIECRDPDKPAKPKLTLIRSSGLH